MVRALMQASLLIRHATVRHGLVAAALLASFTLFGCDASEGSACQLQRECPAPLVCCKPGPALSERGVCQKSCSITVRDSGSVTDVQTVDAAAVDVSALADVVTTDVAADVSNATRDVTTNDAAPDVGGDQPDAASDATDPSPADAAAD